MVENYSFVPGEKLVLESFPPLHPPNADWETSAVDVGETDTVSIAVVGLNEGLPYLAGGGGFGKEDKAAIAGMEELAKKMSDAAKNEVKKATGSVVLTFAFKLLEEYIEELNKASDCRGTAFAFEAGITMKRLFEDHLQKKKTTLTLNAANAANALHIVALSKVSADCGKPDYEVEVEITRQEILDIAVTEEHSLPQPGPPRPLPKASDLCKPKDREIYVWPLLYESTFTVVPSIPKYPTLKPTWMIDGVPLPETGSGTLTLTKKVHVPVDLADAVKAVKVDYEIVTILGKQQLILKTHGEDSNYTLKVGLFHKFDDHGPWVPFREMDLFVTGQGVDGDQSYKDYLSCMEHFARIFSKYVVVPKFGIRPDTPLEDVIRFESNVIQLARVLREEVDLPDMQLGETFSSE